MPITGDCTSGRKRFLWVVSLKGKQQVSLRFLKKGVAASVSLLRRGGVLYTVIPTCPSRSTEKEKVTDNDGSPWQHRRCGKVRNRTWRDFALVFLFVRTGKMEGSSSISGA